MLVNVNSETRQWIRKNGGAVTLSPFQPFGRSSRSLIDVELSFEKPVEADGYHLIEVKDIQVYVHPSLEVKKAAAIKINGYGPFRHLSVSGFKRFKKKSVI
ncbi:CC/Se motif family (seleno)protein [Bacillus sp. FJAT-44742]|uniref:CC/Se motif family (seleno)protein n=1 Tax=Bacillus sp. FJAT-44742 TaxID=2014005 RepID=UPI000C249F2A|nr:CC/Se motif family (seleno)protein [Bacillus sp. FJAT-44742]